MERIKNRTKNKSLSEERQIRTKARIVFSNLIIVPFCVFIKRIDTRRYYES